MVLPNPFEKSAKPKVGSDSVKFNHGSDLNGPGGGFANPYDRLAAHVADFVLLTPLMALAMAPFRRAVSEAHMVGDMWRGDMALIQGALVAVLVGIIWETVFIHLLGATPGRMIFGLKVVDVWTRRPPRLTHAFLRSIAWWVSVGLLGAPFFGVFSNARRRPMHDRIGDTEVVSSLRKRVVALPRPNELAFGAMFTSLTGFFFFIFILAQVSLLRSHHENSTAMEASSLCESIAKAQSEWDGTNVTRMSVALALSVAGELDSNCLERDADYAIWTDRERLLGHFAKGLVRMGSQDDEANLYFDEVCRLDKASDACRVVIYFRERASALESDDSSKVGRRLANIESKDQSKDRESAAVTIESLSSRYMKSTKSRVRRGPEWLRLLILREIFDHPENNPEIRGLVSIGLKVTEEAAAHKSLAAKMTEYRARGLWKIGDLDQARTMVHSVVDALEFDGRKRLAAWLCNQELYRSPCSSEAVRACSSLVKTVASEQSTARADEVESGIARTESPEILIATFKQRECNDRDIRSTKMAAALREYSEKSDSENGQTFFEALRSLKLGESEKAIASLEGLAKSVESLDDPFVNEANIRLIDEVMRHANELNISEEQAKRVLQDSKQRWFESVGAVRFEEWGRSLFYAYRIRGDWSTAAEIGTKLHSTTQLDSEAIQDVAYAAWKAGHKSRAREILDDAGSRSPASESRALDQNYQRILEAIRRQARSSNHSDQRKKDRVQ